ncbi:hypothetical protein Golob_012444 [Gossypium lobatum]|uniref:Subtilisin-like protease fibronectin type-III domain-containing protein n=1 Tax=Gossypium lobatum TaxID=34289 RepID=A0A7J8LLE8_9ROSI|nr:hypothetical protein [Gossypium lobatum]
MLDSSNKRATPFAYGSGHVRPNRAMDPGLVYDITVNDYFNFLCARGYNQSLLRLFSDKPYACPKSYGVMDLNYPSISVSQLNGSMTVRRTVKNVGSARSTYKARVRSPAGVTVSVKPSTLKFEKIGEEKKFEVKFELNKNNAKSEDYVFGELLWSDGNHYVRSPIVVKYK